MHKERTVLIVDDCLEDRQTYCRYLQKEERYNYEFLEQEYGEGGLEAYEQFKPDVILLDYMLPDMDGLEFLQQLKFDKKIERPAVVMLTGEGNENVAVQAMKYGVEDYLVKRDTTPENLRLAVRNVIEKRFLQRELEISKQRFFASVENMLDCFGIYVCVRDDDKKIIRFHGEYLNNAASEDELIGLHEQNTTQERELFEQYCQVIETDTPISTEVLCFRNVDSKQIVNKAYDIRISKLEDGLVATWRDITKRKQSEQILKENQHLIEQIADTTPDIIYLYDLKEKRNIYINRQIKQRLGYSPLAIKKMGSDIFNNLVHPDDLERLEAHHEKFYSVRDGKILSCEYRMRDYQGKWNWFSSRDTVFTRMVDGQPCQLLGVVRDITAQKKSEEALKESEARFRHIFESNLLGVMFWETNGKIVDANQRFLEIIGYTHQDLQAGLIFWDSLTPKEWKQVDIKATEQLKKHGVCNHFEKEYFRKDGSRVPIVLSASMLENYENIGVSFVLDITKRKDIEREYAQLLIAEREATEEAEAAKKAKDEFVAMVSHDLRSPLNAILGWTEILQHNFDNKQTRNRALENIKHSARAQDALIEDLLDISRIVRGKLGLQIGSVSLQSVLNRAIDSVYPVAINKNIHLESEIDSSIENSAGDVNRLQQVFDNLLSNAIKFTPENGRIKVCLHKVKNFAQITIIDTGRGINRELLPHIFERFSQDNDIENEPQGLGLGLAIAHHLVRLHNGKIIAESAGKDMGTTFTVILPLYVE